MECCEPLPWSPAKMFGANGLNLKMSHMLGCWLCAKLGSVEEPFKVAPTCFACLCPSSELAPSFCTIWSAFSCKQSSVLPPSRCTHTVDSVGDFFTRFRSAASSSTAVSAPCTSAISKNIFSIVFIVVWLRVNMKMTSCIVAQLNEFRIVLAFALLRGICAVSGAI